MERRCSLEEEVVRIDILHEDDVASTDVLRTRQALADARTPETAGQRYDKKRKKSNRQPQLPRGLDRLLPLEKMARPPSHQTFDCVASIPATPPKRRKIAVLQNCAFR